MEKKEDVYRTVTKPSPEILYKDRKSKFYAEVHPITSEDDVKPIVEELRKKYHTANHVCYAWQLGTENPTYRANDDGEPNNSAGMPIYGQIQSFDVTNVLITVTRIFGGTKLGVGGLIQAYKTAAQMALESAKIVQKTIKAQMRLQFEYPVMDIVMRTIKQKDLEIVSQKMELDCELVISVRLSESEEVFQLFDEMHAVDVIMMD
ncbi:MAG TPA: YigZ family protein [Muricauda sp.]|uniref:YigZ family protein n=1 Tax=Flagellimonas aurea TaxID=2915619 RepID=A0ABS3G570_9FLAO|nr:YigZ family protein [Allomuricauda aurea]MAO16911.1 YigZ family protein [Allomuricauda sp.]MBO0354242.1 YigZ family protein [Allomuricauda aurea]UBZ14111.1 YigZ family protein [Allomuricauda aquimarina]HBU78907.1 YigZ family protein [Allomuricauda sp.]|tara:strand:+ start:2301 stop:2915 length:615 start_codon:yes stop_codon:yes gene_type:complete